MPEALIIFRDRYEVTADDLNNAQLWRQDSLDDVVFDTIEPYDKYAGFPVSNPTTTDVLVGTGRLYYNGKVYFNNSGGGSTLSLLPLLPISQKKIVAIVAVPNDQQSDLQERDFEVDTTTETYEPQTVAMQKQRWTLIQSVGGVEAVQPVPPVLANNIVVIAYVTLSTAGIVSITQNLAAKVPNLDDVQVRTSSLETSLAAVLPRINTIADDLARLQAALSTIADSSLVNSIAQDVARVKAKLNLPATYVNYRQDDFLIYDPTVDDTTYGGYSCNIAEGLRFPDAAAATSSLQILNAYDPLAKISSGGVLLPAYVDTFYRIVRDGAGYVSLTQYAYQTVSLVQATMSAYRTRYGTEFEAATNSSFFAGGNYVGNNNGVYATFQKAGQNYQVYNTGQVNADGVAIYRVNNYWQDYAGSAYWDRVVISGSAQGYPWAQTFVQAQSGWCTGITPRIVLKPGTGAITFGICKTANGQPDLQHILAQVTLQAADVVLLAHVGDWKVPIEPTFLQSGQRYGYFVITQASYSHMVADIQENAGGTCFYMLDGGIWYPNPSQNLTFDLCFASFKQSQVSINLQPLSLSGGIGSIDVITNTIVPTNTVLNYEIQVNSVWYALQGMAASVLATLPPLVPLRLTFVGTAYTMPGVTLTGSQVVVSRLATVLKRGSKPYTLGSSAIKLTAKATLIDFDAAHHSYTNKISIGGVVQAADTTTDVVIDSRTIERTQVFNHAAFTTYISEQDGTTDSAARPFNVKSLFEFAQ